MAPFRQISEFTSSDGATGDLFGRSVALSSNLALVGADFKQIGSNANQGAAYIFDVTNPIAPVQKSRLVASDGAAGDLFGRSVALFGNFALVGADSKQIGSNAGQGAAYIFDVTNPSAPVQKARIVASDGAANDIFGISVALLGNLAFIGAEGFNSNQGAVYIFDVSVPSIPVQKAKFVASDGTPGDFFGISIAILGNLALIGADGKKIGSNSNQGAAYIFDVTNPSAPVQKSRLVASDGAASDLFGISVALSGNLVSIGADSKTIGSNAGQGAAYIFDVTNPSAPVQKSRLVASDGAASDTFGASIAILNSLVLVGAPVKTISFTGQGAAYVFDVTNPSSPVQKFRLIASDGAKADAFGVSATLLGNLALIGADGKTIGSNSKQGEAYIFASSPISRYIGKQTISY